MHGQIEKEVDDVVADGDNEFITGVVPSSSEMDQQLQKSHSSTQHHKHQHQLKGKGLCTLRRGKSEAYSL